MPDVSLSVVPGLIAVTCSVVDKSVAMVIVDTSSVVPNRVEIDEAETSSEVVLPTSDVSMVDDVIPDVLIEGAELAASVVSKSGVAAVVVTSSVVPDRVVLEDGDISSDVSPIEISEKTVEEMISSLVDAEVAVISVTIVSVLKASVVDMSVVTTEVLPMNSVVMSPSLVASEDDVFSVRVISVSKASVVVMSVVTAIVLSVRSAGMVSTLVASEDVVVLILVSSELMVPDVNESVVPDVATFV